MNRRRSRVIATAVLLGLFGAAIPLVAVSWVSWHLALRHEQAKLQDVATLILRRTERTFGDAKLALDSLTYPPMPPCSQKHIARMRVIAFNTPSVSEVGYFENGILRCTSWGEDTHAIHKAPVDYVTREKLEVATHVRPQFGMGRQALALYYGLYSVLIDPERLIDILNDGSVSMSVSSPKGVIVDTGDAEAAAARMLEPDAGAKGLTETVVYATASDADFRAIASEPRSVLAKTVRDQQLLLLPFGILAALLIIAGVVWISRRRLSPLGELRAAVQARAFVVHYQPIVSLESGVCIGAEALVRWRRPDGSMVRPDLFIPLAEESGLIQPITDQVAARVIDEMGSLLRMDRQLHISINLSAGDIETGRALDVIDRLLARTEILPAQISLEATERGFMHIGAAQETLTKARARGHAVAIDDFGTGYSSLQYLEGLSVDTLKIDKSFIDTIGRNTVKSPVTGHIIDLARTLGLSTVAEGVETEEQVEYLRRHGVDFAQGWYFSKALPPEEFLRYCRQSRSAGKGADGSDGAGGKGRFVAA
ncbi:MAG: EAL domain-containing protein [Neorhizobium sp.]|nr:EAL domain-containing protein [Neorhizobium sp.]